MKKASAEESEFCVGLKQGPGEGMMTMSQKSDLVGKGKGKANTYSKQC